MCLSLLEKHMCDKNVREGRRSFRMWDRKSYVPEDILEKGWNYDWKNILILQIIMPCCFTSEFVGKQMAVDKQDLNFVRGDSKSEENKIFYNFIN